MKYFIHLISFQVSEDEDDELDDGADEELQFQIENSV
jgi:hypothetical protein